MQKPVFNVYNKRQKLVAVIYEVTSSKGSVSYKYDGRFAGCGKDLEEVKRRFTAMDYFTFESI